jgi:UDP-N-acetyl-D-glucosamine dehydrogenase
MDKPTFEKVLDLVSNQNATVGIIGLGYVGLPLAAAAGRAGFRAIGFDVDVAKPPRLNAGDSYIDAVPSDELAALVKAGRFEATTDFTRLNGCDVIVICVPTPLTKHREPDLSYIEETGRAIARTLRTGQTIILESTTWPGTTRQVLKPILEETGLVAGDDFFLGFSPEREDPGNAHFETATIAKVVAGDGPRASALVQAFYATVVKEIVPVSSPDVAEAVKITENIFRSVNIALVNELKLIYDAMGIDVWEVIDAAKTKPFGFMPFYPGPGLGGHCIPIDPFYLTWKAREYGAPTRFIELAGEINTSMPKYVIERLAEGLDRYAGKALSASRILIIGLAYKKNVSDVRESPSFKLVELLRGRGANVDFHDPHVDEVPRMREHPEMEGERSVSLTIDSLREADAVLIATDHDAVNYALIAIHAKLIVDTRNALGRRGVGTTAVVVKA